MSVSHPLLYTPSQNVESVSLQCNKLFFPSKCCFFQYIFSLQTAKNSQDKPSLFTHSQTLQWSAHFAEELMQCSRQCKAGNPEKWSVSTTARPQTEVSQANFAWTSPALPGALFFSCCNHISNFSKDQMAILNLFYFRSSLCNTTRVFFLCR